MWFEKLDLLWAVCRGGEVPVWLLCGGMKLEPRKEAASGVSWQRSLPVGWVEVTVLMGKVLGLSRCRNSLQQSWENWAGLQLREVVQNLTQKSTCCHPGLARRVSRAVTFAGLQLIWGKSRTKHCLKLLISEFLNLLLEETEVFTVCFVLLLFVRFKAADFLQSILWDKNSYCGKDMVSKKLLTWASPPCLGLRTYLLLGNVTVIKHRGFTFTFGCSWIQNYIGGRLDGRRVFPAQKSWEMMAF